MSQGRLLVRPSVAGLVYIRPQEDSNLGMDMRINSIPGQPAIALPSPCSFAGWGPIWTRTVSGPLLIEVGQLYALLAALEAKGAIPQRWKT